MTARLDYQQSCARLRELGLLESDEHPPLPERMPQHDDEEPLGVTLYRFVVEGADLSHLTLPRTFAGRSTFERVAFSGSDLSESNLCWNDFTDCIFFGTDLSGADLRASIFSRVRFEGANLSRADFRHSSLEGCSFEGADLGGTILTHRQRGAVRLSDSQRSQVSWASEDGPEPDGG